MEKLLERRRDLRGNISGDKTLSPAIVIAQAAGSGKSHFLAALGDRLSTPKYDNPLSMENPIISSFTYDSPMRSSFVKKGFSVEADLGLRIVYGAAAHMYGRNIVEWDDFVEEVATLKPEMWLEDLVRVMWQLWDDKRPIIGRDGESCRC
jgi:hypothetical protein